jgi:Flp pilus assembly CpaF family ATPase
VSPFASADRARQRGCRADCDQCAGVLTFFPDITRRHMAVNIREFVLQAHSLDELVALGTLTSQAARFLEAAVASGLNLLVSGGTQAGNPTFGLSG